MNFTKFLRTHPEDCFYMFRISKRVRIPDTKIRARHPTKSGIKFTLVRHEFNKHSCPDQNFICHETKNVLGTECMKNKSKVFWNNLQNTTKNAIAGFPQNNELKSVAHSARLTGWDKPRKLWISGFKFCKQNRIM